MTLLIDTRVRTASFAVTTAIVMAVSPVACSGSVSPLVAGEPRIEAGANDALAPEDAGSNYTLEDVCERTAPKVCALRTSCCQASGGYNEARCLTREKEECAKNVAEVRAGNMTFTPAPLDACVAKLGPLFASCFVDVSSLETIAKILNECRVFSGTLGEGVACERDTQCKPSADANAFVSCEEKTKKCNTVRFLPAAANCQLRDGADALCSSGLYCDAPLSGGPGMGICRTALALGADCAPMMRPLECGLGAYCDGDTRKCTKTRAGGEACNNVLQCSSLNCARTNDAGGPGTCAPVEPLAKAQSCGR